MKILKTVEPRDHFQLFVEFEGGETRLMDVKPFLNLPVFSDMNDPEYFHRFIVANESVTWANGTDLTADTLYHVGKALAE